MTFADKIHHGAAWYPELWRDRMDDDIRLMQDAGVNLVRVGEFAWSSMEPAEGRYDWDWLQQAMDKCRAAGIDVILCTPTPTPPRWLTAAYPDVLRIDVDGKPFAHGSRQHVSHTSPTYRAFSRKITEALASRFSNHPALVGWQTDNEFLCHVDGDFGPSAEAAWHEWLQRRYGTVEHLNETWGARIWSEDYPAFDLVPMPVKTPFHNARGTDTGAHNVSLQLDWLRFTAETAVAFQREQVEIIRRYSQAPITHNHIAMDRVPPEQMFADLDGAATDVYVDHERVWRMIYTMDFMRGSCMDAGGRAVPYKILETSPCHNGSTAIGHATHPNGFLPVEALMLLGLGGDAFCYWLWRQQRAGVEMCHGSVVTSWGTPSIGWPNVRGVSKLIDRAGEVLRDIPPAPAPIAVHESGTARLLFRCEKLSSRMSHYGNVMINEIYRPLLEMGLWRDCRFENANVSRYQAVLSPFMPALGDELVDRMQQYVEAGGTWIVGPMSGMRTPHGTVHTDAGLGRLDALCGIKTLYPFEHDCRGSLGDREVTLGWHCMGVEPVADDCRVLGRYLDGPAEGAAWAVERTVGQGRVVLLTAHAPGHVADVLSVLLAPLELPRLESSWGTTIIPREGDGRRAWLIANWNGDGGTAQLPQAGRDILSGRELPAGELQVAPFEMVVVVAE